MVFETALAYDTLHPFFKERLHLHEPLAQHSSFGIGGPADIWLSLKSRLELNDLINLCAQQRWPLLIVGDGSNILYADAGVRGIVASIALHSYYIDEQQGDTALLIAEPGLRWAELLKELVPLGWGGLEFGIGIPGTLGAGIISNVGVHNETLGRSLEWIEVLDARSSNEETKEPQVFPVTVLRRYQHDDLDLGYRHSRFREKRSTHIDAHGHLVLSSRGLIEPDELIVTLALRVHHQDPKILKDKLEQYAQERKHDDPVARHCGSIFKDPPGYTAHALIEQVGLAGKKHGEAQISEKNANYIINLGNAHAADVLALIKEAHQQVLHQYGIYLALNVELLGEWE